MQQVNANQTPTIIPITTAVFFAISFVLLIHAWDRNDVLKERLDSEKLKSEALLAEKLSLEKSLLHCKDTIVDKE